ncbi:histidine phosphatase family protein [Paenibacillus sp. CC-CFT747]|nr:histidine phosphatase family protein [Paenibacillus sp. CC-CFT747]
MRESTGSTPAQAGRARRTAEIIKGAREVDIVDTPDLKEIHMGVWEGLTQDEAKELYPDPFRDFWENPEKFKVPGCETFRNVSDRALNRLRLIVEEDQGKALLLVAHIVVVKVLMAYFERRPLNEIWNPPYIHPASLCKVEIEGDISRILLHGDTSHYKKDTLARG